MLNSVAVIGLGLIGGSMAKALKKNNNVTVIGYDTDSNVCAEALGCGAVDKLWNKEEMLVADIVVLALSPNAAKAFLCENSEMIANGTTVTDVCGVKNGIVEELGAICSRSGLLFIGSHPMAGREVSGFKNSVAELFCGAYYIITETENDDKNAFSKVCEMAKLIGCKEVTLTTPEEHDKIIAFTSQLPHVLAGAYIKSPESVRHKGLSAGSYRDVSRVAGVDENLWSELFLMNRDNLCLEIELLIDRLSEYKDAIQDGDKKTLIKLIKDGRIIKQHDC